MPLPKGISTTGFEGLLACTQKSPGQTSSLTSLVQGCNPYQRVELFEDFLSQPSSYVLDIPLFDNTNNQNVVPTTGSAKAYVSVPFSGEVLTAQFVSETSLATNDTNYVTFTITNRGPDGAQTGAGLTGGNTNTTRATGGSALTAKVTRLLSLGAAKQLVANDVLECAVTVTGTLGATLVNPRLQVAVTQFRAPFIGRGSRTASTAHQVSQGNLNDNGDAIFKVSATNEAQYFGMDFRNTRAISSTKRPWFQAMVKATTVGANERIIVGLGHDFNATFNSVSSCAWFRLEAGMDLVVETADGTTTNRLVTSGFTLTPSQYYLLTIDMTEPGLAHFYVNENRLKTLTLAGLTTQTWQPFYFVQKDSGTGSPQLNVDWTFLSWDRS